MRTFAGIAAVLTLASGAAIAAARMTPEAQASKSPEVRVEVSPEGDRIEAIVKDALEDDEQGRGKVRRLAMLSGRGSQLGVSVKDFQADAAPGKAGAIVEDVHEGSAAEKAGIKTGDVITEFDGERVRGVRHLSRLVTETPDGRPVKAVVERDGKRVDLTVTPESGALAMGGRDFELLVPPMRFEHMPDLGKELPRAERELRRELERSPREGTWSWRGRPGETFSFRFGDRGRLGVSIQPLEGQLAEYFGTPRGVLVNSVEKDSPAAKAGLKAGDVVTAIDGKPVGEPSELVEAVREAADGATISIDYVRDKKGQSAKATLEKRETEQPRKRQSARPI